MLAKQPISWCVWNILGDVSWFGVLQQTKRVCLLFFCVLGEYLWIFYLHLPVTLMNYSHAIFCWILLNKRFEIGDSHGAYDRTKQRNERSTPRKMNGWNLKNHPFEKEVHLPNLHFWGSILIFLGPPCLNRSELLLLDCLFHEAMASRLRWPAMCTALWWASMSLGDRMLRILVIFCKSGVPNEIF